MAPLSGTTRPSFLIGSWPAPFVSITPHEAAVAVVVAVGMWATRQRRPSEAACPQRCRPAHRPCPRATRPWVSGRPAPDVGVRRCTTRFENAHGTVFRELIYRWHPWFGTRVAIHEAIEKADGVVFRCTLSGSAADRWLEVPAWMFDRAACPDAPRLATAPFVSVDALSALTDLLQQALKASSASSNAPLSGACRSSHDQNRGEAHDDVEIGATASNSGRAPQASEKRQCTADRSVRRRLADGNAGVAGAARRNARRADRSDGAADPGTRAGKRHGLADGGWR